MNYMITVLIVPEQRAEARILQLQYKGKCYSFSVQPVKETGSYIWEH